MLRIELLDHLTGPTLHRTLLETRWLHAIEHGGDPYSVAMDLMVNAEIDLLWAPEQVQSPTGEWMHNPAHDEARARFEGAQWLMQISTPTHQEATQ